MVTSTFSNFECGVSDFGVTREIDEALREIYIPRHGAQIPRSLPVDS